MIDPAADGYCDNLDRFRALAARRSSGEWCRDADVPVTAADDLAGDPVILQALAGGAKAQLQSAIGSLTVRVRCDQRQRRDVAIVPKGGHWRSGRCANTLLQARVTDIGEGGALYDESVRLVTG
ncbi:MAG TPA: hypothetical protein VH374_11980 [Polyangia bacterium]|nr:hypothetical protein [Polyangia bacterium]